MFEESQEPFQSALWKKRRDTKEMRPERAKKLKGQQASTPSFTKLDFTALVLAEGLRTPSQVIAHVSGQGSAVMRTYVSRNQGRLEELIADAHKWDAAPKAAALELA